MTTENEPTYFDFAYWIKRFREDHDRLDALVTEWVEVACPIFEGEAPKGATARLTPLTYLLVAWLDHDTVARIDPRPLGRYYKACLPSANVSKAEFGRLLVDALDVCQRIQFSVSVRKAEPFDPESDLAAPVSARRLAAIVREKHPIQMTELVSEYVKRHAQLSKGTGYNLAREWFPRWGFKNLARKGYVPPDVSS